MTEDRRREARALFMEVADLASNERDARLGEAGARDPALRAEVEALLEAEANAAGFMASPTEGANAETAAMGGHANAGRPLRQTPSESAGQQIDRYKLLQPIGEGGFGTVWMAEQKEPVKRRVALKIIKLGMDTKQVIARFEAERQALAMMEHPNIAKVLDAGTTETGRPYFAMEYIRGVPILEYCDTEKLDTQARLDLFVLVCHAIQHAHQKGIIHRDIKPSNILVTLHDGVPVPKVIDFGIAKATSTELTQRTLFTEHKQMIGTPAYMSPEQAEMSGLDVDTRSDIYSLGVVLYELLTGTTPFTRNDFATAGIEGMLRLIREVEPHKPSTRLSSLGDTATLTAEQRRSDLKQLGLLLRGDLDWIVMKCLEKDRTRRYETANGLADDIKRHLEDEPVLAGPPSAGYKLSKFVKRNRLQVAAGGVVAAALILGVIGTSLGMLWALSEKSKTAEAAQAERLATIEARENERQAIEAANRAEAAEADARARAQELEVLTEFQIEQLRAIDPVQMAADVRSLMLERVPEDDRSAFSDVLNAVSFIDVSRQTLERNVFDHTLDAIETEFADQPVIQASLLLGTGTTMSTLGLWEPASVPLRKALETRRQHLGVDHPDTVQAGVAYSINLHYTWSEDAMAVTLDTLPKAREIFGDEDEATLTLMTNASMGYLENGQPAMAEPLLIDVLNARRRLSGDSHEDTSLILLMLAGASANLGMPDDAEAYLAEALENLRGSNNRLLPENFHVRILVGIILTQIGRFQEADAYYETAIAAGRLELGDDHPGVVALVANRSELYQRQGRWDEAEALIRTAHDAYLRTSGRSRHSMYVLLQLMGVYMDQIEALTRRGQTEAARHKLEQAGVLLGEFSSPENLPEHRLVFSRLVSVALGLGETDLADRAKRLVQVKPPLPLRVIEVQTRSTHYIPSGYMGDQDKVSLEIFPSVRGDDGSAVGRLTLRAGGEWGGMAWLNPPSNWGAQLGGWDLTEATTLRFEARSVGGSSLVNVSVGINNPDAAFPDSGTTGDIPLTISEEWASYEIDLTKLDRSRIAGGLIVTLPGADRDQIIEFDRMIIE
ncbi:MAG: serine/threonine-protein kinase [Planctomycetota bacterium]